VLRASATVACLSIAALAITLIFRDGSSEKAQAAGASGAHVECFGYLGGGINDIPNVNVYNPKNAEAEISVRFYDFSGALSGSTAFNTLSGGEAVAIGGASNSGIARARVRVSDGPNVRVDGQVINGASGRQVTCVRR
jgi:hypothetical protein